ncbi:MAG: RNA polymerase sigma-70 factor [Pseudobacter sp.]|uniref:RNA polymerase sigma-70 factor n=1 Tax=Pseudobacter sp. TaxID=2045420 RepID=UPI003F7E572E
MQRFNSGDQAAFTSVYHLLYERLYWYGRRYIESEADVEDVLADAYAKLWGRRTEFHSLDSVTAFLHVIVRNQCLNFLRDQQLRTRKQEELIHLLESEAPAADFSLEQVQLALMKRISEQVDQLPAKMRAIFLMSYQDGLKPAQIAEKLSLNVQTVKNQKANAIRILKLALSNEPHLLLLLLLITHQESRFLA